MPKNATPTFIHEFPMVVDPNQERKLLVVLDCARHLYNACFGEALRRLSLMRESKVWNAPPKMEKGKPRTEKFNLSNERYGFRKYDIDKFATKTKNSCHRGDHLPSHIVQKVADRAFAALQEHCFGKRGCPRFKGFNRFNSIEGKSNATGIYWRGRESPFQ